jgi:hypothetical protein
MNISLSIKLAERISVLLLAELRHGIEPRRMVAEPLYARDVLLVCDACLGTELPALAQQFRAATAEPSEVPADRAPQAAPRPLAARPTAARTVAPGTGRGFGASRFISSLFGSPSTLELPAVAPPPKARHWFSRPGGLRK